MVDPEEEEKEQLTQTVAELTRHERREQERRKALESLERRGLLNTPPQENIIDDHSTCDDCGRPMAPALLNFYERGLVKVCNECDERRKKGKR